MKNKAKIVSIILFLSVFIMLVSCQKQKTEWKGTIKEKNGVTVVKNPIEPLYGEITFELEEDLSIGREDDENYFFYKGVDIAVDKQENIYALDYGNCRIQKFDMKGKYLHTIGRKGQGPGEFESPGRIFLDSKDNIYVNDSNRMIIVYSINGEYLKSIKLNCSISDFYISSVGYTFAISHLNDEIGIVLEVVKIDSDGNVIKKIADFRGLNIVKRTSGDVRGFFMGPHEYNHQLCFSSIDDKALYYAYSSEYQVILLDNNGNLLMKIQKEENPDSISQKEKNFILNRARERLGKRWPKGV